ncbi:unnamed protein product [Pleuronectes platessa]|uniref:Uncharacterized protein n=1 Tax=Pleuronectes platessa TaxID=8262 RepID=A0A9N7VCY0_PLEPL|nr:unnamed protein product [Pleuronectes platessa]
MVLRPLGYRLPARLPARPAVSAALNHSSFWLQLQGRTPFNANQCHAAEMPHTEPVIGPEKTVPLSLGQEAEIQVNIPTLPSLQINKIQDWFCSIFCRRSAIRLRQQLACGYKG